MKKSLLIASCLLTTLLAAPSFKAEAAGNYTYCGYELVAGAPWAAQYRSATHSGHIQCEAYRTSAIGYYKLVSQRHL